MTDLLLNPGHTNGAAPYEATATFSAPTPLEALKLGRSLIPVGRDKKPLVGWKGYQDVHPTEEELGKWERTLHPDGWAVVTGEVSGEVTFDFDGPDGRALMEKWGVHPHRRTPSGGFHLDVQYPGFHIRTVNSKADRRGLGSRWPGLDVKGDGGYVMFTGSAIIKGSDQPELGSYIWLRNPREKPDPPSVIPEEVWEFLRPPTAWESASPARQKSADPKSKPNRGDERVDSERLLRDALAMVSRGEGRNNSGVWLCCQLRDNGFSEGEAQAIMGSFAERCPSTNTRGDREPYTKGEVLSTIRSVYSTAPRQPWANHKQKALSSNAGAGYTDSTTGAKSEPTTGQQRVKANVEEPPPAVENWSLPAPDLTPDLLKFMRNDVGNSERLLALHGDEMRYCSAFKKWLLWNGRCWAIDDSDRAQKLAVETIRKYFGQAVDAREDVHREFANRSLDFRRTDNMLKIAHHDFRISPRELDADPWLLNSRNGTVDLRTSQLHPHRKEDFITKLIHYDYNHDAPKDLWLRFLYRIMGGNADADDTAAQERAEQFVRYLQRGLGYSLTGVTSEKAVFIPFGSGDNGKSTMLTVFRQLVGDYGTLLQVDTLMTRQESNNTQADLADLRGARFVQTSEVEEGQRFSQGKLKRITQGMGTIKAVRKYENPIEFKETHKLWIDTNHKPLIRDADDRATFSRLHPIPFTVRIPKDEIDKEMPNKLALQAEGILAWAVEGARLWKESGLMKPQEVDDAKDAYRAECDQLGRFLDDRCVQGDGFTVLASALYAEYEKWCEANGEYSESANGLGRRLTDRGFGRRPSNRGPRYDKLGLRELGREPP